ncbi:hypothetical protein FACS189413_02480 [Bacteroidia bacterium]|nr:hypothetical protein FACS189413_02480 [Bacteroidia bacterium]
MRKILICFFFLGLSISINAQIASIVGEWKTVDDKTGEFRAVVKIYQGTDSLYYGKIVKMLKYADAVCESCEGSDKGKPVLGMIIIRSMKVDGEVLNGGYLLDPESGKKYYGTISYDAKTGKLKLRGSLDKRGWLGRNQYWVK